MMTTEAMRAAEFNDAELVAESLNGNREAFRQIVERYQTLISSLAYCATGNVSQSEDLAQETFVTAWKKLADLREPAKLRPWLCSITRFLISKEFRRQGREPVHAAESLEADEWVSPEPLPPDQVISEEEKAILWRSLERIPEIYREPLVLFYREQQSIEAVARDMELSEDAVKQRLSRGRKLLQEQFLAFVAGALKQTAPDKTFTLGVMAALPLLAATAKAATAGVAIKGGSTVKVSTSLALLGAVLTADILFQFSLLVFLAFTGGCIGYMMGRAGTRSAGQFQNITRFWRALAAGFGIFLVLPWLAAQGLRLRPEAHPGLWQGMTLWLGMFFLFVPALLLTWIWRWWRGLRQPETAAVPPVKQLKKRFTVWFTLGMIGPACFLGISLCAMISEPTWITRFISEAQVQKIITGRKDATYSIDQSRNGTKILKIKLPENSQHVESALALLATNGIVTENVMGDYTAGSKTMWMKLPEKGRGVEFIIPADESLLALLATSGMACSTAVEGRDYDQLGLPLRLMALLPFFITPMGLAIVLRRPWRCDFQLPETEIERDERNAKMALKAFAVSIALVLLTAAVFVGVFLTRWNVSPLSTAEVRKVVANLKVKQVKGALISVYQYSDGTKELCLPPNFTAPADTATLAILAENGIEYRTFVQGRDFGYGSPRQGVALFTLFLLVGGAGILLWQVSRKVLAVVVALILAAVGILVGLRTTWHAQSLSTTAAQRLIVEHPAARFDIIEYNNGSKELWITPSGSRHRPRFITTADDATLALLAENKIPFRTVFGYGVFRRGTALLSLSTLAAGVAAILWWAWKKKHPLSAPAEASL
jgi:RNA polymerase sigma factor (sigma-70 family)